MSAPPALRSRISRMLPARLRLALHDTRVRARRLVRPAGAGERRPIAKLAIPGRQTFFGYYDKTPFSTDDTRILVTTLPRVARGAADKAEMEIGVFDDISPGGYRPLGSTTTWCWQQSCRLQWLPGAGDECVIHNTMVEGGYGAVIRARRSGAVERTLAHSLYDVGPRGKWGLSLNFSRLQRLRPGYGYTNLPDHTQGDLEPAADGVWLVDLESGAASLVLPLRDLARLDPCPSMNGAEHYVNHLAFNPTGDRFMVIHLWVSEGHRYSRLITADREGGDPWILANNGHASHYAWKAADELLVFSTHRDTGTAYHLYHDRTSRRRVIGEGILVEDGHPSFTPDGRFIITDTYPDRFADRHLLQYSLATGELRTLTRLFSPPRLRGEVRCDLHPRLDRAGRRVIVDSAHEDGVRAMYIFEIPPSGGQ